MLGLETLQVEILKKKVEVEMIMDMEGIEEEVVEKVGPGPIPLL